MGFLSILLNLFYSEVLLFLPNTLFYQIIYALHMIKKKIYPNLRKRSKIVHVLRVWVLAKTKILRTKSLPAKELEPFKLITQLYNMSLKG